MIMNWENLNSLRAAILLQARRDGVLGWWCKTEEFHKLFPDIDETFIQRVLEKEKKEWIVNM